MPDEQRRRYRFLLPAAAAVLAGTAAAALLSVPRRSGEIAPAPDPVSEALSPSPVPPSPFLNTAASVSYVGSARCVGCHAEEHASYLHTAHSRSLSAADASPPPEGDVRHPASLRRYRVTHGPAGLRHEESLELPGGPELGATSYEMRYAVGSGRFGHSYLAEADGYLIQSPVTWYSRRRRWDMSPGYDLPDQPSFQRNVSADCLFCHAGRVETEDGNPFRLSILEEAIGCERCHGPGALHVERRTSGWAPPPGEADTTIVDPERLPRELAEAVCRQCHLQGDAQVAGRGRDGGGFRPGLPLEPFRFEFREPGTSGSEMTIVGHVEQMRLSPCWKESGTLTCSTCHDSHRAAAAGPERYRAACLACHADESCREPPPLRAEKAGNDCTRCHMPQVPTEVPHVAFTQHRIGLPGSRTPPGPPPVSDLVPLQDLAALDRPDRDRALGLAHVRLAQASRDEADLRRHLGRGGELLRGLYARGLRDPSVTAALAEMTWRQGARGPAVRHAEEVLSARPRGGSEPRVRALEVVAGSRFADGEYEAARDAYRELAGLRRNARYLFFLGLCEQNCGDTALAVEALERSLAIDPAQTAAPAALAALYSAGRPRDAERLLGRVDAITRATRQAPAPSRGRPPALPR